MKKKILLAIISLTILLSILVIPANAATPYVAVSISENYTEITYKDSVYVMFDEFDANLNFGSSANLTAQTRLTSEQKDDFSSFTVYAYNKMAFLTLEIFFKDGGSFYSTYIRKDLLDDYERFINSTDGNYILWNDLMELSDKFFIDKARLFSSEPVQFKGYEVLHFTECDYVQRFDEEMYFTMEYAGAILRDESGDYYYFDYSQEDTDSGKVFPNEYDTLTLYRICDSAFITKLDNYYSDISLDIEIGDVEDEGDSTTDYIGNYIAMIILLSTVFLMIPLAIFVPSVVLAIANKRPYRWLFLITALIALIAMILFIIFIVCLPFIALI